MGLADRQRARAIAAERARDWAGAADWWRAYHAWGEAQGDTTTRLREAHAALQANRPTQAREVLEQVCRLAPADSRAWLLRLEMLRLESRPLKVMEIGWTAWEAVLPAHRRRILMGMTLALLSAVPEAEARSTLDAWLREEPANVDVELARLRQLAANPQPGDPPRAFRIERLEALLVAHPNHPGVRERLVDELADAGDPVRGREVLESWPEAVRDARFDQQQGRWFLEFDHRPEAAVEPLGRAIATLPFDLPTRYRYARSLQQLGRSVEARAQVARLRRLREATEPTPLERRLSVAVAEPRASETAQDMAGLCESVGLDRMAQAWKDEARRADQPNNDRLLTSPRH